ncbi:MAG: iron ABC transporter substrate-binding protein [Tissierellia bacterium]|nr:iron ABC transporter substrate-binding protein [Tissierellia bacterium]
MKTRWILLLCCILSFTACSSGTVQDTALDTNGQSSEKQAITEVEKENPTPTPRIVTDLYGREVEIPAEVQNVICTGSGALRVLSYLEGLDYLIGVEEADHGYKTSTKRDYAYIYHEIFAKLPLIGKGGGTAYTAYPEEIVKLKPDLILSTYQPDAVAQLEKETGIPVVSIRYTSTDFINESFYQSMRLTAEILGLDERCEELLSTIDQYKEDLSSRTIEIPDADKKRVYTGAVTYSGAHGFAGTYANFGPLMAIHGNNVADETGEEGGFDVDLEQVIVWDPQVIFLDPGNMDLVNEEVASNPGFFQNLTAVKEDEIYTMPSFNNYSTNITYCLMDAYYAGKILYPDKFSEIDMEEKGNEILEKFLGRGYFSEMEADGLFYGKLKLGE